MEKKEGSPTYAEIVRLREAHKNSEMEGEIMKESEEVEEACMSKKRRRRGRKEEKEERRWCGGEFSHDDFTRDGNNLHCTREEGGEIEQRRESLHASLS